MKAETEGILSNTSPQDVTGIRCLLAWTDFQTVLVVAQCGSVAKACVTLAMSHVTLLRKLDAIETRLKAKLFKRVRGRYTATAAGDAVIAAASSMEPLARDAELRVLGQDLRPSGLVRVTATSILVDQLLPSVLKQFAASFPDVVIEFATSREHAILARREADVAIRISDQVPEWLVGRKLGEIDFCVYELRRKTFQPTPRSVAELVTQRRWISFEHEVRDLKFDRWLDAHVPDASVVLRVDGFSAALAMLRGGLGMCLLPTFLERTCPELKPLCTPIKALRTPLWLLTHQELRQTMRIKVLMQAFGPALANAIR